MIRKMQKEDKTYVLALAQKLEMFDESGLEMISETVNAFFEYDSDDLWFVVNEDRFEGVIYCMPEPMTSGTWNIQMLLVNPDSHGKGYGQAMINEVTKMLREKAQRLLIVETSGLDGFERARKFYHNCGFTEEARIKNFYEDGDDKIVFTKRI